MVELEDRIKAELADVQSSIFRKLIAGEKIPAKKVAEAFYTANYDSLFEANLICSKLAGKFPTSLRALDAFNDKDAHLEIAESIIKTAVGELQFAHPKFIWTAWITRRQKPL